MNRIVLLFRTAAERRRSFGVFRTSSHGWLCEEPRYVASSNGTEIHFIVDNGSDLLRGLRYDCILECPGFFRPTAEYLARVRKPVDT